nr:sugar phosphate isomerase/epimerase [Halomonas socia]
MPSHMDKWKKYAAITIGCSAFTSIAIPSLAQQEPSELPIAVQMYTLRDFGDLEEQMAAVQRSDVGAIETVGDQGVSSDELKALLAEYELEVISSHIPLEDLRHRLDETIAFNRAIGNDTLTLPYLDESERPESISEWQSLGQELGDIASRLNDEGFRLAYHNHEFEMEVLEGKTALEHMFDAAGPNLLVELDIAWVARGGLDPAEYVNRFEERLFAVHAKDNSPEGSAEEEGGFATLGMGVLDWETILPVIESSESEWYIIEHDHPIDAEAVITEGSRFLCQELTKLRME